MVTKIKTIYTCQQCGFESAKWAGKCPECGQWNSFAEEQKLTGKDKSEQRHLTKFSSEVVTLNDVVIDNKNRYMTGIGEFDRILGGGIMPAPVVLLGGQPGIGKSTLMLQVCDKLCGSGLVVLYVSGEESLDQIKHRADRLDIRPKKNFYLVSETNLENILESVKKTNPDILVIDSIQTTYRTDLTGASGTVGQIRECSQEFLHLAKGNKKGVTVFLLGHVTKEGDIAGPRVLEHIVDTVLYFETEKNDMYRILRSHKNRFGPTSEIGVFEMKKNGLAEVANPSELFLAERNKSTPGSVIVSIMEGTRPFLLEVQALVTRTNFGMPRRMVTGLDYNRAIILIAVLETRVGLPLEGYDIFVNIAGGIKVREPDIDLGICLAIHSAYSNINYPADSVYIGEVGLSGEIRGVSYISERVAEAEKLGFSTVYVPKYNMAGLNNAGFSKKLKIVPVDNVDKVIINGKN